MAENERIVEEPDNVRRLVTERKITQVNKTARVKRPKTMGEQTFNYTVGLIIGCWVALGLLYYSLRHDNV